MIEKTSMNAPPWVLEAKTCFCPSETASLKPQF